MNSLQNLNRYTSQKRCILGGDFNIITSLSEKQGGLNQLDLDSEHFKEILKEMSLVDWETNNGIFT